MYTLGMNTTSPLRQKSYAFALHTTLLCKTLASDRKEYILSKQLLKSGTSVGANVEEAQQAESRKDFISKLKISAKEASESRFWIRLICDAHYVDLQEVKSLLSELNEVTALLNASIATAKRKLRSSE